MRFQKIIALVLFSSSAWAGFNFGECSGSGTFKQEIHEFKNYEDAVTVGVIPAGLKVYVLNLQATKMSIFVYTEIMMTKLYIGLLDS